MLPQRAVLRVTGNSFDFLSKIKIEIKLKREKKGIDTSYVKWVDLTDKEKWMKQDKIDKRS